MIRGGFQRFALYATNDGTQIPVTDAEFARMKRLMLAAPLDGFEVFHGTVREWLAWRYFVEAGVFARIPVSWRQYRLSRREEFIETFLRNPDDFGYSS